MNAGAFATVTNVVTVTATATNNPVLTKNYPFMVGGAVLPPHSAVDTIASPHDAGTTTGDGVYTNGTTATVTATANAGGCRTDSRGLI